MNLHVLLQFAGQRLPSDHETLNFLYGNSSRDDIVRLADAWTFPRLSQQQLSPAHHEAILWVAALEGHQIVGFALLSEKNAGQLVILSFKIHPEFRDFHYGVALMKQVENLAAQRSYRIASVLYRTYWKSTEHWEALLQRCNWKIKPPRLYYAVIEDTTNCYRRLKSKVSVSNAYDFIEINAESLEKLKTTIRQDHWQGMIPQGLNPLQLPEKPINTDISFLVVDKTDQSIIGWAIAHVLGPQLNQLTTLFLLPKHRGAGLELVVELARRQQTGLRLHFIIQPFNELMLHITKAYLLPVGCRLFEERVALKTLKNAI